MLGKAREARALLAVLCSLKAVMPRHLLTEFWPLHAFTCFPGFTAAYIIAHCHELPNAFIYPRLLRSRLFHKLLTSSYTQPNLRFEAYHTRQHTQQTRSPCLSRTVRYPHSPILQRIASNTK